MITINADNVNGALHQAVKMMRYSPTSFDRLAPRGGNETMEWICPVTTVYARPWRMVLFNQIRDANPFFHLMESIWMLVGRRDAQWLSQFTAKIGQFAEDDGNFHGAYGWRWRNHFEGSSYDDGRLRRVRCDQLVAVIELLRREPATRRAVLAMWDPVADLGNDDKRDLPCNTTVYFKIRGGILNMTVCCRSNDIILGAYGANAVHFGMLHAFVSAAVGARQGRYTHVSDSWHYYVNNPYARRVLALDPENSDNRYGDDGYEDYYTPGSAGARVSTMEVVSTPYETWLSDAKSFVEGDDWNDGAAYGDTFFRNVAVPVRDAYAIYRRDDIPSAVARCQQIHAPDWRRVCTEWLLRRQNSRGEKR